MYFNEKDTLSLGFIAEYMWDRCGVVCPPGSMQVLSPIGVISSITFEQACHNAAKTYANKEIFLYWSGGLDSTLVFLLLREYVHPSQLTVLYTQASLEEYPGFFEKHIAGVYKSKLFTVGSMATMTEKFCQEGVIVTGEIGDQVFGSGWFIDADKDVLQKDWKSFRDGIFLTIPNIEQSIAKCPQKITNIATFLWWLNYTLKYQYVQIRMLLDNKSSILNTNIFHFFDTPDFNSYTVSNPMQVKMPGYDLKNYKYPLRELIAKLSGDNDYAFNKPKVRSWRGAPPSSIANAIDTNWTRYYASN